MKTTIINKTKLHFGHGILIVLILFMSGILLLAYKSGQQRVDLVSNNYYDQELKYESQIEKERKSLMLNEDVRINYNPASKQIIVRYPGTKMKSIFSGTVNLYKPDNAALDYSLAVNQGYENSQLINTTTMSKGLWRVKVNWVCDSISYYKEEKIIINQ